MAIKLKIPREENVKWTRTMKEVGHVNCHTQSRVDFLSHGMKRETCANSSMQSENFAPLTLWMTCPVRTWDGGSCGKNEGKSPVFPTSDRKNHESMNNEQRISNETTDPIFLC